MVKKSEMEEMEKEKEPSGPEVQKEGQGLKKRKQKGVENRKGRGVSEREAPLTEEGEGLVVKIKRYQDTKKGHFEIEKDKKM